MAQILIIDDERSIRNVLKDILTNEENTELEKWGYGVQASNFRSQAGLLKMQGKNAFTSGLISAGSSFIGGAEHFGIKFGPKPKKEPGS